MISSNQLVEWIHFDDVKGYEWTLESTYTAIIDYLLLRTHIVEGCQVDNVTNFCKVYKWINQPTGTDRTLELHWLLPDIWICFWQGKNFNPLTWLKFFAGNPVFRIANEAECICEAVKHVIVKCLIRLWSEINLVPKYL